MRYFRQMFFAVLVSAVLSFTAFAQETQVRVIDEVFAQVNDGVIPPSRVKREYKSIVQSQL